MTDGKWDYFVIKTSRGYGLYDAEPEGDKLIDVPERPILGPHETLKDLLADAEALLRAFTRRVFTEDDIA
jgi:hypothetical protein